MIAVEKKRKMTAEEDSSC